MILTRNGQIDTQFARLDLTSQLFQHINLSLVTFLECFKILGKVLNCSRAIELIQQALMSIRQVGQLGKTFPQSDMHGVAVLFSGKGAESILCLFMMLWLLA